MTVWVLQTGEPLPLTSGSTRMRSALLNETLVARGHKVCWWASAFDHFSKQWVATPDEEVRLGPDYTIVPIGGLGYRSNVWARRYLDHRLVARKFRRRASRAAKPDVMLAGMPDYHLAWEAVRLARAWSVPVIVDVRDQWPHVIVDRSPARLRGLVRAALAPEFRTQRAVLTGADALVSMSEEILEWAVAIAGRPRREHDRVFLLGNQAAPAEVGLPDGFVPDGRFVVTYVGTFGAYNHPAALVEAAELLRRTRPDVAARVLFVLAGEGGGRADLVARAQGLPNVVFPGWVGTVQMHQWLRVSSVAVLPWHSELPAFPNKAFAYLEAGLPILSAAAGELEGLLAHYNAGATARPMTAEWLVDRICGMESAPDDHRQMRSQARRLWADRLDRDRIFPAFADYVEQIARGAAGGVTGS